MTLLPERGTGWAGRDEHARRQYHEASSLFFSPSCLVQLEQSEAKCEDALKTQKALTVDLENMHSELENMTRCKSLVPVLPWSCGDWGQHRLLGTSVGLLCAQHHKRDKGSYCGPIECPLETHTSTVDLPVIQEY